MKTYVIQTRLDKETIKRLKHLADNQERTVSALIRFVLKNYLKGNTNGERKTWISEKTSKKQAL